MQIPVSAATGDPRVLRLPRPAQQRARPVQGRRALPPGGRPRRGARAGGADDAGRRALAGMPFGGAKGGINVDRERLHAEASCERITRSFIDAIEKVLGPDRDIPAPDVDTNAQMMAWMMDEYGEAARLHARRRHRQADRARRLAGPRGGDRPGLRVHSQRGRAGRSASSSKDARVIVQGFGNVGSLGGAVPRRAGRDDRRRHGPHRRDARRRRASTSRRCAAHAPGRHAARSSPDASSRSIPTRCWRSSATC